MKLLEDGRVEHRFRQSWHNTYIECPEQARLILNETYPSDETSSAAEGTAVHAAIQAVLVDCADYATALQGGIDTFCTISADEAFRWVKTRTEKTALAHIEGGFSSWYRHVYPTLGACVWIEHPFEFTLFEDDERVIVLTGTVDYGELTGLTDWKLTTNRDKYGRDGWKLVRAGVQPTYYAAAAYEEGLFPRSAEVPFRFVALSPQGHAPQYLDAPRNMGHVDFLVQQLRGLARVIEVEGTDQGWPLRDQSPLCSETWCLNWRQCKGKYVN